MENFTSVKNLIEKNQNIFILLPEEVDGDKLGGALSLFYTLKKLNKNVNLVLQNVPEKFKFLQIPEHLNSLKLKKNFTISLSNLADDVSEIYFDKDGQNLRINFFSKDTNINEKDFNFSSQKLEADLLITIGAKNLDSLGRSFKENPQIFYEKPILNIDHDHSNESYGEVNLLEPNLSGVSEIIGLFLKDSYDNFIDTNISTSLLAGIIFATQNFQNYKTTPESLSISSYLIQKNANHQAIIQNLYALKDIESVKLMGQVLGKLNFNKEKEVYWASLSEDDFVKSNSTPKTLSSILEGLKTLTPASLMLLWESHGSGKLIRGILYSQKRNLIEKISKNFNSTQKNNGVLFFVQKPDILTAEKEIFNIL